jgi:rhamnosyltransferase
MTSNNYNLFSIIVVYNPDYNNLFNLCQILSSININVVLVDNSDYNKIDFTKIKELPKIHVFNLYDNFGIAKAQNIGINYALNEKADAILFFDQDSQIDSVFLSKLISPLSKDNISICAPVFIDLNSEIKLPIISINKCGLLSHSNDYNKKLDNIIVISSGLIVKSEIFSVVGLMNEEYFIDYVDTDFCFRCFEHNFKINVVSDAIMKHPIGENMIKIFGLYFFIHNPQRIYYQTRNCLIFSTKKYVPLVFRLREIISFTIHQLFLLCFYYKNRKFYIKALFYGFIHGILGKNGKFQLDLNHK